MSIEPPCLLCRAWVRNLLRAPFVTTALFLCSAAVGAGNELPGLLFRDSGQIRRFQIAPDECFISGGVVPFHSMLLPALNALDPVARAKLFSKVAGEPVQLVLYEQGVGRAEHSRRILLPKVLVELRPGTDARALEGRYTVTVRTFPFAPGYAVLNTENAPDAPLQLLDLLKTDPDVIAADPMLGRKMIRRHLPNDPLFPEQWYLLDRDPPAEGTGVDLNLTAVWDQYRGRQTRIAVIDDGLQLTHPDLPIDSDGSLHYDFRDGDADPSPTELEDVHGTAVAGLAAGRSDNAIGIAGVAPEAALVAVRLIGADTQSDEQSADAILHAIDRIQISNNSWGAPDSGQALDGPGPLAQAALKTAVETGRGGKGTIFVWSAGNGGEAQDNANYDGYANSIYTVAVAGVTDSGTHASFSEPGACLVVSAPGGVETGSLRSGITTTDLLGDDGVNFAGSIDDLDDRDYTQLFGGTSAAAPMIAGLVALMLEANPALGWRDVQEILIRSARRIAPDDPDWQLNSAGLTFHHQFGAGLADAATAVGLSILWTNLPPQNERVVAMADLAQSIPDNQPAGVMIPIQMPPLRVEHAAVTVDITHPRRGDLAITLISPSGMRSRLAERHLDLSADYQDWTLTSVFHWGEHAEGIWTVEIADLRGNRVGTVNAVELRLYGTAAPSQLPQLVPLAISDREFTLKLLSPKGGLFDVQSSVDLVKWESIAQKELSPGEAVELILLRRSESSIQFYRAVDTHSNAATR